MSETITLPGIKCAACSDPNRRNSGEAFIPPVYGPHGHCNACGRPMFVGNSHDSSRACSPCFKQAMSLLLKYYAKERTKKGVVR